MNPEQELAQMNWEIAIANLKDANKRMEIAFSELSERLSKLRNNLRELREYFEEEDDTIA
jgi:predicted  nucleic acid-binding Zn-ribbon protein